MTIHFILSNTAKAEHIGFTARALKTMGHSKLRLVNPCEYLINITEKTAYGSYDILEQATTFRTLAEATADLDFVIGTTAKRRKMRHDYLEPTDLAELLDSKEESVGNVGIAFGSEQSGLTKEEIECCSILSTVPMSTRHPSLNLSQAVLVYAYELRKVPGIKHPESKKSPALHLKLRQESVEILNLLAIDSKPSLAQRLLDRSSVISDDDSSLLLAFIKHLKNALKKG